MNKKLNIRPDTGVYGTYKRISYEAWTALAEFVDNSTQSFYDHKKELFETKYYDGLVVEITYTENPLEGDEIKVTDNAFGMDYTDFSRALLLDKPPKNTSGRNEFGMGLKAAACWFGNLWSVETTALGSQYKYTAELDIDNLVKYKNEDIEIQEEIVNSREHFTVITIKKLNKKIKGKRIEDKIRSLLSSIYRVDLRSGDIKIYYNGNLLEFNEVTPYTDDLNETWKKSVYFKVPYKDTELEVKGFIGIRIPGSPRDAGYTLLRRGRVIVGGPDRNYRPYEIFGASNSFVYQRLYGELEMDNWPVTQAKDAFDWSNEDLESKFIEKLKTISEDYIKKASEIRTREKVKVIDIVKELQKSIPENNQITDLQVKVSNNEEIPIFEDNNQNIFYQEETIIESSYAGTGIVIQDNKPIEIFFKHEKEEYKFKVVLDQNNSKGEWLKINPLNIVKNEYELTINSSNNFFYPFIQKSNFIIILIKFSIALALAEIESYDIAENDKISPSTIRLKMGEILEELSHE